MALSQYLLSVTLLVLGAPPLHHHCPKSGPICARHGFGSRLSPETGMGRGMDGDWLWDTTLLGFSDGLLQHQAPTVVLLEAGPPSYDLNRQTFSSDLPAFWTPVPYGPLTVEVRLVTTPEMVDSLENVVLLLDNRPLEARRHALPVEPPQLLENGLVQVAYRYSLPCPPPGKHMLQARYKLDGIWSRLSAPLYFDVRLPDAPQIIGISNGDGHPVPVQTGQTISINSSTLKYQLAHVNHNATLVAYLNGQPVMPSSRQPSCCRTVRLKGRIPPGVHRLTVRTVHRAGECTITSEASNEVVFHYYDESVYLLKPGRNCGQRQHSTDRSCAPTCTDAEQEGNSRPAAENPASDLPSFTAPGNGFGVTPNPIVRYVVFRAVPNEDEGPRARDVDRDAADEVAAGEVVETEQVETEQVETGETETGDVCDEELESVDSSRQATELLNETIVLRRAITNAIPEIEKAAGEIKGQVWLARQASQTASDARETTIQAREIASSSRKEASRLIQEANAYSALPAADARKQAQQEWLTVEEEFRKVVRMADPATIQAQTADDRARRTEAIQTRTENELEAARAFEAKATQVVANIRTLAENISASETPDDDLERIKELRSSVVESRSRVIAKRDLIQRLRDSADVHRLAAEQAKTEADQAKNSVETARRSMGQGIKRLRDQVNAARYLHVKSLRDELEKLCRQAKTAAERANHSLSIANWARDTAADHESAVREGRADARHLRRSIGDESEKAKKGAERAERNAQKLGERGDSAEAREAGRQAKAAALARDAAIQRTSDVDGILTQIRLSSTQALESLRQAADRAEAAEEAAGRAAKDHRTTDVVKQVAEDFLNAQQWLHAIDKGDEVKRHAEQVTHSAAAATEHATAADAAIREAATARAQMQVALKRLERIRSEVAERATDAQNRAAAVGGIERFEAEGTEAWERAIAETVYQRHRDRRDAATDSADQPADVRLAEFEARAAEELADHEQAKADARIRQGQAEARYERALAVIGPPSPFYFAAPAHFPIRGFGAGGEAIERPGAVIYEDMVFSFDREGNYNLRFSILIPDLPTKLHLQLQLQPYSDGHWYTITLPPQQFRPENGRNGRPQPRVFQDHVIQGRSEILRRCYGEMGKDATIRRTGSARFGYGFDAMRDTAAR